MTTCSGNRVETPKLVAGSHPPASGYAADIVILTQNRFAETLAAVRSAQRQRNVACHISLLDQGSPEPVQRQFAEAFKDFEDFGYYTAPVNLGVGGGRNFRSALGTGKIIVALDNDAVFADDLVVAQAMTLFVEQPELGVVGFKILAQDGIRLDKSSWGYPAGLRTRAHGNFLTTAFVGAGHAIRRASWTEAGGYDADLFFTWEEYDFALRVIALRWSVIYAGQLAVVHNVSPEARVQWQSERMRLFVRNRIIVARKWRVSWLRLLPRICGYLLKAMRNRCLMPALSGIAQAIVADRRLFKQAMHAGMRRYLHAHETSFRGGFIRNFYHHVILEMQADPKG